MKVILFELNEVPQRVLDDFCDTHPQSALSEMRASAMKLETVSEDGPGPSLSPWFTWPSVHRGVPKSLHNIAHLGQPLAAVNREYPSLWTIVAEAGGRAGVCGSLHSYPVPEDRSNYDFYLPDTFAPEPTAFPPALESFQRFNLVMARESARNLSMKLNLGTAMATLPHLPSLGFGPSTFSSVLGQLVSERLNVARKVRRRTTQSVLAFDAFMAHLKRSKPDFATFFTNHLAAAMHRFWAASYPDDFAVHGYDRKWIETFGTEVDVAVTEADRMVRRLLDFVKTQPDYLLVLAGSMGQAAAEADPVYTELTLADPAKLLAQMGVSPGQWRRGAAMVPDYAFEILDGQADAFEAMLRQASLAETRTPLKYDRKGNFFHLSIYIRNPDAKRDLVHIGNRTLSLGECGLGVIETDFQQGCTGYHIPEGLAWVYGPSLRNAGQAASVSSCELAPAILSSMGITPPSYMRRGLKFAA